MHTTTDLFDAQQGFSYLISQIAHIEREVYAIEYPDIQYPALIPVDTSANEWSKTVTYFSSDKVGEADWVNQAGQDIPYADTERAQFETTVHMAAIGYEYTLEEVNQARLIGQPRLADRAEAARRAFEEFVDGVALQGDAAKNFSSLIDFPGITAVSAPDPGAGADWPNKTTDQILDDVNALIDGVYTSSNTVETADTLLIPHDRFPSLASQRLGDTSVSILEFLRQNNVYSARTGQPLTIRSVKGLDTAGAGSSHRMIAYRRDRNVLRFHMPMPHRFLAPQQVIMHFKVPGIFRLGGLDIRRPGAVRYMDGI